MSPLQKLESLAGRIFYWGPRSEAGALAGSETAHVSEHAAAWNEQITVREVLGSPWQANEDFAGGRTNRRLVPGNVSSE
ncbi:protein kinase, cAMP-dependent, catalytic, alpha [Platysternon megacephalum]|uniref:Protein kinase, cAMP-dependent, catalytic, alpha n=1 Tax=Platysternon megacephalum TaxID=55544 RepID=A0A4D9DF33_9SAUR|nr:protein kinase, cAMP-dependent, catalytic, alpha [Platysternon megacephalum]